MKSLLNWLDDRTGYRHLMHEALYERIPGGARWRYVWGSTLVFAFVTQLITGLALWLAYSPSKQTAWESVYYIQHEMWGGWLLRGVHHFMAQAMIVLLALHLLQVVIDGAYRAPREVNFWLGLILMNIVLGLSLTGYLLPWDQKAYWATSVATNLATLTPGAGAEARIVAIGGGEYGHHTLTRFFALHAGVLPGLLIFFLILHLALFRKHGIKTPPSDKPAVTFWPDQVFRDAVACLAVMIVVLLLSIHFDIGGVLSGSAHTPHLGAELGPPADPSEPYNAARPEWYFLSLFQLLKYFKEGSEFYGAIVLPGVVMSILFLMPFIGRSKIGHAFNVGFLVFLLLAAVALTFISLDADYYSVAFWRSRYDAERYDPERVAALPENDKLRVLMETDRAAFDAARLAYEKPYEDSDSYRAAVQAAHGDAERVKFLIAEAGGIPVEGALGMLRRDPETRGRQLFIGKCASCHSHVDGEGAGIACASGEATAPNLHGFASREWLRGLFDPKQIASRDYFGGTAHAGGEMAGFVERNFSDLADDEEKREQLEAVIVALSYEAQLKSQAELDAKAAEAGTIEKGRELFAEYIGDSSCVDCHKFHDQGEPDGPDLTGYGSLAWLKGIVADPSHERYYGDKNDRMPAFAPEPAGSPRNQLTEEEIELIAKFIRGDARDVGQPFQADEAK